MFKGAAGLKSSTSNICKYYKAAAKIGGDVGSLKIMFVYSNLATSG